MQTVCGNPFFVDNVVAKTYHITEQFQKQKQKENKNNLGLIGRLEKENHLLFSSSGANGIINAFCGVEISEDILSDKKHQFEGIFFRLFEKK